MIHKSFFSGFSTEALEICLREQGVKTLVLAGVHLHGCIRSTALDAYSRGYKVIVAEDTVGGYDVLHGAMTQRYLDGRVGDFRSSHEIGEVIKTGGVFPDKPFVETEVASIFEAARSAHKTWRRSEMALRRSVLEAFSAKIELHAEELANLLVEDVGKPISLARGEVKRSLALIQAVLNRITAMDLTPETTGWHRVPQGVVALISPFNNPLAIPIGKLIPALLCGNVVVWKPAPAGSRIAQRVAELFAEIGSLPGLLQVVTGGKTTASHCMSRADAVTLSGSPEAGVVARLICSEKFIPLQAELGGNNAAIVWADADLERAAAAIADGAFAFAGQRCTANRRVILDKAVYPQFVALLQKNLPLFQPGDPKNETTRLGPLISTSSHERLERLLERALADGCELLSPPAQNSPTTMAPVLLFAADPKLEIVQEESFGPILVIQKATDWQHALELLNGVRQGLAAACFTTDGARIADFLDQAQCGILKINRSTADADVDLPFGGWKTSGLGPAEHGAANLEFFTKMQTIYR